MSDKLPEKAPPKKTPPKKKNPAGEVVAKYGTPVGVGFLEGAIAVKVTFYGALAPEAKAVVLGLLGVAAIKKNKLVLGGALLALAGRYTAQRVVGGGAMAGLQGASDAELEEVADRYGLGDTDDDDMGALPGASDLRALPGADTLGELDDEYDVADVEELEPVE